MKRTTLFVALVSALSLSAAAYAHGNSTSQDQSSQSSTEQSSSGQQSDQNTELVKQAQEKLGAMGKDVGDVDGMLGPKTQQALKEYQEENGLQPNGQLDQQTIAALNLDQGGSAATGGSSPSSEKAGSGSRSEN